MVCRLHTPLTIGGKNTGDNEMEEQDRKEERGGDIEMQSGSDRVGGPTGSDGSQTGKASGVASNRAAVSGVSQAASFYQRHKVWIWIAAAAVVAVVLILIIGSSGTQKYVGTDTKFDVSVELESNGEFTLTETTLATGEIYTVKGTYEYLGSNDTVIRFNIRSVNGETIQYSFTCQIMTNIYGTPFISFTSSPFDYPPCYKQ